MNRRPQGRAPLRARSLALVAYGEVGSSLIFALGVIALYALGVTPWVLLAVGALVLLATASYVEGVAAVPERGGAATLVRRAFNDPAAFATGWVLFLDYLVVIALAALFVPHYLGSVLGWEEITRRPWDIVAGVGVVATVVVVRRLRRVNLYAIAVAMAAVALVSQLALAVAGIAVIATDPDVHLDVWADLGTAPSWTSLVLALSFATLAYTGLETAVNFAAETRAPALRRGLVAGIGAVVVLNVLVSSVGVSLAPAVPAPGTPDGLTGALGTEWLRAPLVGVASAIAGDAGAMARLLEVVVGVASALVLVTAIATAMAGGERVAYSMARYDMLPHVFARPERGTVPSAAASLAGAALAAGLLIAAAVAGQGVEFLASLYSFGVLVALTAAQVAVVALRVRDPGLDRPYRVPMNVRIRGVPIPVPAVVGALLTASLWIAGLATHSAIRVAGPVWLAVGAGVYMYSRRVGGEGLLSPATAPAAGLVPGEARDPRRILVPVGVGAIGEEVMATALRIARRTGARVDVVHVVEVPMSLGLDAPPDPAGEEAAREAIDEAREIADEHHTPIEGRVVRARGLAEAIVAEAVAVGADLIVMGSSPRRRGRSRLFGPTVDEVLRDAPCEVMVVAYPAGVVEEDGE